MFRDAPESSMFQVLSMVFPWCLNSNISTQSGSRRFPSGCLRVRSFVDNGVSKIRRLKTRKEETETKIIFLLTWAHKY